MDSRPSESAQVAVARIEGGWSVTSSFSESFLVFRSGAEAERAAHKLTRAAVLCGRAVDLRLCARPRGDVAGFAGDPNRLAIIFVSTRWKKAAIATF
jgi:hypothetical protein